ncbi:zinc finger MYM-type protein 1-like [Daphnia magna]|uniref:zinc finger MYM-type protein 1-like n=1 Tax=Daphnia magna TaxID=35525 RepID=UPI001E1BCA24|nr:zinc finger MYM-type protein 1-like [Daphnia magna]
MMGEKLLNTILEEIKLAKYYTISVDSTPDLCHIDQLSFTVRYVFSDEPAERFLKFVPITAHNSAYLAETVLEFLKNHGLDIKNCRGQSYDNASNMSGQYTGLQARIKDKSSTHRWETLTTALGPTKKVVKRLSDTRWSARADAVTALFNGYSEIQQALNKIAEDQKEQRATSHEAESLSNKMDKLETAFLSGVGASVSYDGKPS